MTDLPRHATTPLAWARPARAAAPLLSVLGGIALDDGVATAPALFVATPPAGGSPTVRPAWVLGGRANPRLPETSPYRWEVVLFDIPAASTVARAPRWDGRQALISGKDLTALGVLVGPTAQRLMRAWTARRRHLGSHPDDDGALTHALAQCLAQHAAHDRLAINNNQIRRGGDGSAVTLSLSALLGTGRLLLAWDAAGAPRPPTTAPLLAAALSTMEANALAAPSERLTTVMAKLRTLSDRWTLEDSVGPSDATRPARKM